MNMSFYTASIGAGNQQLKMDVVANNIANVNTKGYQTKNAVFSELMYRNLNNSQDAVTNLKAGSGVQVSQVKTNFTQGGFEETGRDYDYAILGRGFFMLSDPVTQEISYTRDGRFQASQRGEDFYLATTDGKLVLDTNRQPIRIGDNGANLNVGIFGFAHTQGMESIGDNEFQPIDKNGEAFLETNATLKQGSLELSGVDVGAELAKVMESQMAYSYALKMVQTSDEVIQTINSLR